MKFLLDVHTHTVASGHAIGTVAEHAAWAKMKGLQLLGIADHGPRMGSCKLSHFQDMGEHPVFCDGVWVYMGVEANIMDEGGWAGYDMWHGFDGEGSPNEVVDMPAAVLGGLDYAIASMHGGFITPGDARYNTDAVIRAMQNPWINIIGHVCDRSFPIDTPRVVEAAKRYGCAIEINNLSLPPNAPRFPGEEATQIMLQYCMEMDVPVIAGSDAHSSKGVGDFSYAARYIEASGIPERLVLNTDVDMFLAFINAKRDIAKR